MKRKMTMLLTVFLTFSLIMGLTANALAKKPSFPAKTVPSLTTQTTADTITVNPKNKNSQWQVVKKQVQQASKVQKKVQIAQKQVQKAQQKLMAAAQFTQLLNQEVEHPRTVGQKQNVARALQGVIRKIETMQNGRIKLSIQRGDNSKVLNTYFTANLDPAKTLVYDRTLKAQKTMADLKTGDVVKIIPVRGASLFLVDRIGHRDAPATTTGDTITATTTDTITGTTGQTTTPDTITP